MKKRVTAAMLAGIMALSLAGCGSSGSAASTTSEAVTTAEATAGASAKTTVSAGETTAASGQESNWPTGPVSIFIGAKAGSNLDIKARLISKYLTEELGQPVVVDNRPGAGGITACTQFLAEEPNSNSLQYFAASYLTVAPIYNTVEYKPDDFVIAAGVDSVENGFFVDASLGIKTLDEFKAYAEGKVIKFASTGIGSDTFLLSRTLMDMMDIKSDTVTGNGFPDMIVSTIAGDTEITYCALETARQYVAEGSLVPLAVCNADAYTGYAKEGYAEVPSLSSLGYDIEYATVTWLAMRAGTDEAVLNKLRTALDNVYANEAFQAEMSAAGFFMLEDTSSETVTATVDQMVADCRKFSESIK